MLVSEQFNTRSTNANPRFRNFNLYPNLENPPKSGRNDPAPKNPPPIAGTKIHPKPEEIDRHPFTFINSLK